MEKFQVAIVGCGATFPSNRHWTSTQMVNIHEKIFMVDCGEGAQALVKQQCLRVKNLGHIFISHAHGDHVFGLIPFVSTFTHLDGGDTPLHLYLPVGMVEIFKAELEFYVHPCSEIVIHEVSGREILHEDLEVSVESIPLNHRVPCCGFLFREKAKPPVLLPEKCRALGIPPVEFSKIKAGADYRMPDGTLVPNSELTAPSTFRPRAYAYCSDTAFNPAMVEQIRGVNLLYHEATFLKEDQARADVAAHSTAEEAATIARMAGVGRLAIGHYSIRYENDAPLLEEAKAVFPNTVATQEGMVLDVE